MLEVLVFGFFDDNGDIVLVGFDGFVLIGG